MNSGASNAPLPPVIPRTPARSNLSGTLTTGYGALKNWPFILRRDGKPVDSGSLGGSSPNAFQDGYWWSGASGEYQFSGVPEGYYSMEVMQPTGKLKGNRAKVPPVDSGLRAKPVGIPGEPNTGIPDWDEEEA